ncbi:hypothetical protein GCM10010532_067050 [Dactylosporangium siamense]|uniref:Uncharacterized protein n=1 Tax=Dactylosporangium siamense TaxID=685454 RepID=A0A919PLM9_9ACTN|nr:hypothetical protein Dsi01nite_049920 [Dactylosporangium siamense]
MRSVVTAADIDGGDDHVATRRRRAGWLQEVAQRWVSRWAAGVMGGLVIAADDRVAGDAEPGGCAYGWWWASVVKSGGYMTA